MSGFWRYQWRIDEEGNPEVTHFCEFPIVVIWRPPNPPWKIVYNATGEPSLVPSFDCDTCGAHLNLGPADMDNAAERSVTEETT